MANHVSREEYESLWTKFSAQGAELVQLKEEHAVLRGKMDRILQYLGMPDEEKADGKTLTERTITLERQAEQTPRAFATVEERLQSLAAHTGFAPDAPHSIAAHAGYDPAHLLNPLHEQINAQFLQIIGVINEIKRTIGYYENAPNQSLHTRVTRFEKRLGTPLDASATTLEASSHLHTEILAQHTQQLGAPVAGLANVQARLGGLEQTTAQHTQQLGAPVAGLANVQARLGGLEQTTAQHTQQLGAPVAGRTDIETNMNALIVYLNNLDKVQLPAIRDSIKACKDQLGYPKGHAIVDNQEISRRLNAMQQHVKDMRQFLREPKKAGRVYKSQRKSLTQVLGEARALTKDLIENNYDSETRMKGLGIILSFYETEVSRVFQMAAGRYLRGHSNPAECGSIKIPNA